MNKLQVLGTGMVIGAFFAAIMFAAVMKAIRDRDSERASGTKAMQPSFLGSYEPTLVLSQPKNHPLGLPGLDPHLSEFNLMDEGSKAEHLHTPPGHNDRVERSVPEFYVRRHEKLHRMFEGAGGPMRPATNYERLAEFHHAYDVPVRALPGFPSQERIDLRLALIEEEVEELKAAIASRDLVEVADALADLKYVTYGTDLEFGIPADRIFAEVHWSNMTKLGEDGKPIYREDGKVLKGPNFQMPRIAQVLSGEVNPLDHLEREGLSRAIFPAT